MEPSSLLAAFLVPGLRDAGSIPHALQAIKVLCTHTKESRMVCLRVHARLRGVWQRELQFAPTATALRHRVTPVIAVYGGLLIRFRAMLRRFATGDRVLRLILNRQLFVKLDQMHRDIDAVQLAIGAAGDSQSQQQQELLAMTLGRVQWEADRRVQLQLDRYRSGYTAVIKKEIRGIVESDEVLAKTLTQVREAIASKMDNGAPSVSVSAKRDTEEERAVVFVVTKQDTSETAGLAIANWSVARRDLMDNAIESGGIQAAHKANQESANGDDDELQLRGLLGHSPVRSHSACHLCTPVAFAFEDATDTSSFIETCVTAHRAELITLLYKVELSLHFSHENELFTCVSSDDSDDPNSNLSHCELRSRAREAYKQQ